jgi:hypothetical protein
MLNTKHVLLLPEAQESDQIGNFGLGQAVSKTSHSRSRSTYLYKFFQVRIV